MADILTAFFHSRRSRALALFFYENALKIEEELEELMAEEESLCRKGLLHERMADAGEEALLSQSLLFHRKKAVECFRQYAKRIQEDRQKSEALCHHLEKNLFKEIWLFEEVQEYARAAEALEELYACIKEREKKSRKQGDPSGSSGRNCDLNGFHAGAQWKF